MKRRTLLGLLGLSAMPRIATAATPADPAAVAIKAAADANHELDGLIPFFIEEINAIGIGRLERRSQHSARFPTWECAVGRGIHELHSNITLVVNGEDRMAQLRLNTNTAEVELHTWSEYFSEKIDGRWQRHRFDPMTLVRKPHQMVYS